MDDTPENIKKLANKVLKLNPSHRVRIEDAFQEAGYYIRFLNHGTEAHKDWRVI